MSEENHLLERVLGQLKADGCDTSIFLKSGIRLRGRILDFDQRTILMEYDGMQ